MSNPISLRATPLPTGYRDIHDNPRPVRAGLDPYDKPVCDDRGSHYCNPPTFAVLMAPLADPFRFDYDRVTPVQIFNPIDGSPLTVDLKVVRVRMAADIIGGLQHHDFVTWLQPEGGRQPRDSSSNDGDFHRQGPKLR